jgi:hypothetical protein
MWESAVGILHRPHSVTTLRQLRRLEDVRLVREVTARALPRQVEGDPCDALDLGPV